MALVPIFTGRVTEQAQLVLPAAQQSQRHAHLRSLAGKDVEIVIRKKREQRSLDQNAYIHAVPLPIFAEYWGEDIETTKLLLLGEKFGWRETHGTRLPVKPRTSALSTGEMSAFIEWMPMWGMAEFGLRIPLPNEAEAA